MSQRLFQPSMDQRFGFVYEIRNKKPSIVHYSPKKQFTQLRSIVPIGPGPDDWKPELLHNTLLVYVDRKRVRDLYGGSVHHWKIQFGDKSPHTKSAPMPDYYNDDDHRPTIQATVKALEAVKTIMQNDRTITEVVIETISTTLTAILGWREDVEQVLSERGCPHDIARLYERANALINDIEGPGRTVKFWLNPWTSR